MAKKEDKNQVVEEKQVEEVVEDKEVVTEKKLYFYPKHKALGKNEKDAKLNRKNTLKTITKAGGESSMVKKKN